MGFLPPLLVAVFLLAEVGAWASHDCCGHPSESGRAEGIETGDPETGTVPQDGDCISACCQTYSAIPVLPQIKFHTGPRLSVEGTEEFAASYVESDIFRPPLA